ncbi:MAG: hypothetical protein EOP33_08485 [Rickettsiaceae bacterium]|nr:MAG: hypothetical protein EOP33_08485 [Rickettsiaceae bacterium]
MPAAAVIPAPLAYIKVVAVKKLVVECSAGCVGAVPLRALLTGGLVPFVAHGSLFRHLIECEAGWFDQATR